MDNPGVEITAGCLQKPSEEIGYPAKRKFSFWAGYKAELFFLMIEHQTLFIKQTNSVFSLFQGRFFITLYNF